MGRVFPLQLPFSYLTMWSMLNNTVPGTLYILVHTLQCGNCKPCSQLLCIRALCMCLVYCIYCKYVCTSIVFKFTLVHACTIHRGSAMCVYTYVQTVTYVYTYKLYVLHVHTCLYIQHMHVHAYSTCQTCMQICTYILYACSYNTYMYMHVEHAACECMYIFTYMCMPAHPYITCAHPSSPLPQERVLAFHLVGPNAGEITQGYAVAIRTRATKSDFDATIGIHPTTTENFTTMDRTKSSGEDPMVTGC